MPIWNTLVKLYIFEIGWYLLTKVVNSDLNTCKISIMREGTRRTKYKGVWKLQTGLCIKYVLDTGSY